MPPSSPISAPPAAGVAPVGGAEAPGLTGESLPALLFRRSRYVLAIALSAVLLNYLAWSAAAAPPAYAGLAVLPWYGPSGLLGFAGLAVVLLVGIALSMGLTHPDAPHTGIYCAFLGLGYLAIKGGTAHMLLEHAHAASHLPALYHTLAAECALWALAILAAEGLTRLLFRRFFYNTAWVLRGHIASEQTHALETIHVPLIGPTPAHHTMPKEKPANPFLTNLGALAVTAAVGIVLLNIFLQSQDKGQVLFAAFVSFGLAAVAASYAFPEAEPVALWLAVPLAAAVGYWWASPAMLFPGYAPTPMARALPIDYVSAGVPGAIIGYYMMLGSRLYQAAHQESEA